MSHIHRVPLERIYDQFGFENVRLRFEPVHISKDGNLIFISVQLPGNRTFVATYDVEKDDFKNIYQMNSTLRGDSTIISDNGLMLVPKPGYSTTREILLADLLTESGTDESISITLNESGFPFTAYNASHLMSISDNGRFAIITSNDDILADAPDETREYIIDLETGFIEPLPPSSDGPSQGYMWTSNGHYLSDDGSIAAYDGVVYNRLTGEMSNPNAGMMESPFGTTTTIELDGQILSGNGQYVIGNAAHPYYHIPEKGIFRYDINTGASEKVFPYAFSSSYPSSAFHSKWSISDDGRFVSLMVGDNSLDPGDLNNYWDVYVKDMATGAVTRASAAEDGGLLDGHSYSAMLSGDGRVMVFKSDATTIHPGGADGQIYVVRGETIWYDGPAPATVQGTPQDDFFLGVDGSAVFDGGEGRDTVAYDFARDDVAVELQTNGTISVNKPSGTDTLISIERVEFDDGVLLFDIESFNAPAAYRLYGGAFDRTPDEGGFLFWVFEWLDAGRSLRDAAIGFIASPEFTALYGGNLSDAQMVDQLYLNVLGRPGEAEGVAFWNGYLSDGHGDHADLLVHFTQLPEYVANSQADIANGYWVI